MRKTIDHEGYVGLALEHFAVHDIVGAIKARYPADSDFVFSWEGGYVNDKDDPGGCTNMGITIGTLRAWRGDDTVSCDDVKALTKYEASLIYATSYWSPIMGNQLPIGINTQVYDFGVNAGPSRAVKELQRLVAVPDDGIMGPQTLDAVLVATADKGAETLIAQYTERRQAYYESLSTYSKYGAGWTNRNNACYELAVALAAEPTIIMPPLPPFPPLPNVDIDVASLDKRLTALETWRSDVALASMEEDE